MYKATIVIPNINGKGWLKDSIESVYAQTEQNFRLIVVDNGSTDESLEQARSYCSRENFTLIENGTNTGFSHAVNQGIALADSEYVVLFNNDAFAEPQWLEELIRTAETDPKIFAVQSLMIRHFDRELADDAGDYVTWMGFACKTGDGRRASRYTRQKRIFSACGGAALYRKSILDEIGNFDENFFAYFEDVDLSWRANNAGYKNLLCPTAKCYHICGASTGAVKYNAFKSQQSGRNSILLPLKNEPLLMLILNFIPLAVGYLLKCYKIPITGGVGSYRATVTKLFKKGGLLHVTVGYIPTQNADDSILVTNSDTPTKYMDYLFSRQSGSWYLTGLTESETKAESTESTPAANVPEPMAESDVQDAILAAAGSDSASAEADSTAADEGVDTQAEEQPADSTEAQADESAASPAA